MLQNIRRDTQPLKEISSVSEKSSNSLPMHAVNEHLQTAHCTPGTALMVDNTNENADQTAFCTKALVYREGKYPDGKTQSCWKSPVS